MTDRIKYLLGEDEIPRTWYNLAADLPNPEPLLHPGTGAPIVVDDLTPFIPEVLARQELSREREIEIPEPVRQIYAQWRPSPMFRARRLERALDTPAHIYYKYEGGSPAGSHKPNTAIAQAYYNKEAGINRLATETGAGQWGSSLSLAGAMFDIDVQVFMVKVSYHQKPYRRLLMETYGARCVASPSVETEAGRAILAEDPDCSGSLGIATSEAMEIALNDPATNYAGGSVLNHVLLHQSVIGQEAIAQMTLADDYPDIVIGCAGGGSNLGGLAFPFIGAKLRGGKDVRVIAAEPAACPTLTRGKLAYDFGDTAGISPLLKMHTLGRTFIPPSFHAGGLRYHGMAPLVSDALMNNLIEAEAVKQTACFAAGIQFARAEGIVPAPESTHAIEVAIREALRCREEGTAKTILFGLSGHGHFDLSAYEAHLTGALRDEDCDEVEMARALADLPGFPGA
ncbi:tryptophan synthase beta chain [Actinokineospora alba]|uniref:tryptophan synthase n=1 Tax=Actinokineospora alba TaxID=504798 RepID=A0A1H0R6K0_9PSEU|nr:TrpB-like pyridoxal phosphate-dependent enzyme [Actinokineospora alba]TDP70229.1 tryptophan synthase beta chain [Actinokineospora alba]SDI36313.1 tryptophan synthase beta chain [Actinokineospora alba]SDP25045.1 tryptophan synthase beta chain [Actinokineospora alba]